MKRFALIPLVAGLAALSAPAFAQYNPQSIGEYRDWSAWVDGEGRTKICFIASKPKTTSPKGVNRGDIYVYVTHRPAGNIRGEVAVRIGYPFANGREGIMRIGKREIALQFDGDKGWPVLPSEDSRAVNAMKAGSKMTIRGISSRGTKTSDSYSLLGFTAAYNAITKACK